MTSTMTLSNSGKVIHYVEQADGSIYDPDEERYFVAIESYISYHLDLERRELEEESVNNNNNINKEEKQMKDTKSFKEIAQGIKSIMQLLSLAIDIEEESYDIAMKTADQLAKATPYDDKEVTVALSLLDIMIESLESKPEAADLGAYISIIVELIKHIEDNLTFTDESGMLSGFEAPTDNSKWEELYND